MTLRNLRTGELYDDKGKPLSSKKHAKINLSIDDQKSPDSEMSTPSVKPAYFFLLTLLARMGTAAAAQTNYTFHESTNRELCTQPGYYQFCNPFYVTNSDGTTILNGTLQYLDNKSGGAYGDPGNFKCMSNNAMSEIENSVMLSLNTLSQNAINPVSTDFCTTKVEDTGTHKLVAETVIQGFSTEGCNQFESEWHKELKDCSYGCCDCCGHLDTQVSLIIGGAVSLVTAGLFAVKKYCQPQIEASDNKKPDTGPAPQTETDGCLSRLFSPGISNSEKILRMQMNPPVVKIGEQESHAPSYISP